MISKTEQDNEEVNKSRSQRMGILGAISYIVGNIVGSGIFITPTTIYTKVNSVGLSLVVWALSGVISLLGSLCYVELGTCLRMSGGDFALMCFMNWYPIGFPFMCIANLIIFPATLAIQAQTFSEYIFKGFSLNLDESSDFWAKKLTSFSLIWILMFLNFFSLKTFVSRFAMVAIVAKILATGTIIGIGTYFYFVEEKTENVEEPFKGTTFTAGSFVAALFAGLFSYDGWDILAVGNEEIERPKRTMPIAIIIAMITISAIYIAMNFSYFVILDRETLLASHAVATDVANATMKKFSIVMPILVSLTLVGSLNATIFAGSRYLQAVAKQGLIPTCLSGLHPQSDSPRVAVFVHVILSMGIMFAGDLGTLVGYVAFAQWSQRCFTMIALIWIRFRKINLHPDGIRLPIVILILFFIICTALTVVIIIDDISGTSVGLGCFLGGLVVYIIFLYSKALPSIQCYKQVSSRVNGETTAVAQVMFNVMPEREYDFNYNSAIGKKPEFDSPISDYSDGSAEENSDGTSSTGPVHASKARDLPKNF